MVIRLRQLSVLAGAYHRQFGPYAGGRCLDHYVVEEPLAVGRMRRAAGDTLCRTVRPEHVCDIGGGVQAAVCPLCLEAAHRLSKHGHQIVIVMG